MDAEKDQDPSAVAVNIRGVSTNDDHFQALAAGGDPPAAMPPAPARAGRDRSQ